MDQDSRVGRIINHYTGDDEDSRLRYSKAHRTEFLTTNYVLERYIKPHSLILDLGAATGCYSFHYAKLGHRVFARDLAPKHIEALQLNPLCGELGINAAVGDAGDLSEFADRAFDVVLCLGPLYHIGEPERRRKCVSECFRVLKAGGILAVA